MTTQNISNTSLPKYPEPYWKDSVKLQQFSELKEDIHVDVAIIGGGITGITAAYLLVKEGLKVALLEASNILNGTTAHTSAKITNQHGLIYDEFINHFGAENAKLYYQANDDALKFIVETINENQINCDLTREDAYIYTNDDQYLSKLDTEFKAYQKLDINGEIVESIPLDMSVKKALVMKNQAQFHPLKYLQYFVQYIIDNGGLIYENTIAIDVEDGPQSSVITREGFKISSKYVISSSHFPFYLGKGFYFTRMYAERAYVLGVKTKKEFPGGMYISAESPTRSLRYTDYNGEKLVLVIGESHKTGHGISEMQHYKNLQSFGEKNFGIEEIKYRWSTQDLTTLDKLPYIGPITSNHTNFFVATGYRKWGMTNGTAAALILRDAILNRKNPYFDLFSPSRFYADPSLLKFISLNAKTAKHLVKGKLKIENKTIDDLQNDEGAVVTIKGNKVGAYKDIEGKLHMVDITCTHLGCELNWNSGDRTWDCGCHGSRFSVDGDIIESPAIYPLEKI